MELGLSNKRVLVTGSSQGIGKAIAATFLQEGAVVVISGRDEDKLRNTQKELQEKYGDKRILNFCGDMTRKEDISLLHDFIETKVDGIDILISNIGTGKALTSNMLDVGEWKRLLDVNLVSAVTLTDVFQDILKRSEESSIVFVSSVAAKEVSGAPYAYAASKEALLVLSKRLSEDLAEYNIRVNCVLPGNVLFAGGRWEEILKKDYEDTMKQIRSTVSMKRLGAPQEIADAVVFLSSGRASFITGTTLVVDGGQLKGI